MCWVPNHSKADRILPKCQRACYTWSWDISNVHSFSFSRTSGLPTGTCNTDAKFETKHYTQTPLQEVWQYLLDESVQTGGKRLWQSRETGKTGKQTRDTGTEHEKREIQGPNIAGNARYRYRTSRETRDTGTEHRGKREIQGPNITKNWRWRNQASRETWVTETEHGMNRDTQERTLTTGTRQRQRALTDVSLTPLLST